MLNALGGSCLFLQYYQQYGKATVPEAQIFLELEKKFGVNQWLPRKVLKTSQAKLSIYNFLCMEDQVDGSGRAFYRSVDDVGRYGKNIPIFYYDFREQLSYFRNIKQKKAMDIGSAMGMTLWKELLNGFNVTAVDLTYKKAESLKVMKKHVKTRAPEHFESNLQILAEDIFDLPSKYSQLKGTYNFINVQNVLHFYSPNSVDKMIKIISSLLKEGGRAVITAETINSACDYPGIVRCHERIKLFQKKQDAPYVVKYKKESGEAMTMKLLQTYTEEEVSFFSQNQDVVLEYRDVLLECVKVFFDFKSLDNICRSNNFRAIDHHYYGDGNVARSISLVVEKLGDIAAIEGEM